MPLMGPVPDLDEPEFRTALRPSPLLRPEGPPPASSGTETLELVRRREEKEDTGLLRNGTHEGRWVELRADGTTRTSTWVRSEQR